MALSPDQEQALKILGRMLGGSTLGAASGGYDGKNFGPGFAARPGGRVWDKVANPNARRDEWDAISGLGAAVDLAKKMQSDPIDFDAGVVYIPGEAQKNAGLVRTPENLEAFVRQSEKEHEDALKQFMDKNNIPPEQAAKLGVRAEQGLAKWWNDHDPRRPVTPTSSCVKKVRLGPNGDIYVTFGSSEKEYQYEGSSDPVQASKVLQALVTAPSIGKAVNSWTGDWGKAHTYLPK